MKEKILECKTLSDICRLYNFPTNGTGFNKVRYILNEYNISEDIFNVKKMYEKNPKLCKECGEKIPHNKKENDFCNSSCSAKHTNKNRTITEETKEKTSKSLTKYTKILENTNHCHCCEQKLKDNNYINLFCDIYCHNNYIDKKNNLLLNNKNKTKCYICGDYNCISKICLGWSKGSSRTFIKLGFDETKIGTSHFHDEYNRIKNMLLKEYENNSVVEISEKYNIFYTSLYSLFKKLKITIRKDGKQQLLAFKKGRSNLQNVSCYPYKSGYHTSWEGKTFWLRSSYELEYAK